MSDGQDVKSVCIGLRRWKKRAFWQDKCRKWFEMHADEDPLYGPHSMIAEKVLMDTKQDIIQMKKGSDFGTEKRLRMEKCWKRRRSEILLLFVNIVSAKILHQIVGAKVVDKLEIKFRTIIKTYWSDHFQDCSLSRDSYLFLQLYFHYYEHLRANCNELIITFLIEQF